MNEYKRECQTLESELKDIKKRAGDSSDHLRIVDAWWSQLLDEVTLLTKNAAPSTFKLDTPFPTAAHFKNSSEFSQHLSSKAKVIKEKINEIMTNLSAQQGEPSTQLQDLREKFAKLLASQKEEMVKFDRIRAELEQQTDRYSNASLRALKAEKKLERAKSQSVQKIEAQLIAAGTSIGGIGGTENGADSQGAASGTKEDDAASKQLLKEVQAVSAKQKEQLDELMKENETLTQQLTAANIKLSNLTDDDYAQTNLFKNFKAQHEEVIKRINHLEATNIQLREEAEKLQAERTAYRNQLQEETDAVTGEVESQMQRLEADLARIRSSRDELIADQSQRKASQDQERHAIDQMKELVGAKEERINSLESEVKRLKAVAEGNSREHTPLPELEAMDVAELRKKYIALEQSFESINNELPAMEKAYKRAVTTASKKVMDFAGLEDKCAMLIAAKAKADEKYFAARKDIDSRNGEIRALRAQNAKSSEIITAFKDAESRDKALLTNLERQISDFRRGNSILEAEHKKAQTLASNAISKLDSLNGQVDQLKGMLKKKDSDLHECKGRVHTVETDLEKLRVKFEKAEKDKEHWKKKSLSNQSGEEADLRVRLSPHNVITHANVLPATCSLQHLQRQLQEHRSQDVWPPFLQRMCRCAHPKPYAKVPELLKGIRQVRCYGSSYVRNFTSTTANIPLLYFNHQKSTIH